MAIRFDSFLPEVLSLVPGCSDLLAVNALRNAAIELCEKSEAYQLEMDPITTIAGIHDYEFEVPASTVVHRVMWVSFQGQELEPISTKLLEQRQPKWRTSDEYGKPVYYIKLSNEQLRIVPVPDATESQSLIVNASLKPTQSANSLDNEFMNDYKETLVNGAAFRLLRQPSKDWTDFTGAQIYGSLFNEGMMNAYRRANNYDMPISRKVKYGGYAGSPVQRRRSNYRRY